MVDLRTRLLITHRDADEDWRLHCEHCDRNTTYDVKSKAVSAAKQHVRDFPEGMLSQVLVQDQQGKWQSEWTYGKDPYPPKG